MLLFELTLRHEMPDNLKAILLIAMIALSFLYAANSRLFYSIRFLSVLPFQRFNWQSEQYMRNPLFRFTSLLISVLATSLFIYTYSLGQRYEYEPYRLSSLLQIVAAVGLYFIVKLIAVYAFFALHQASETGAQLIDFESSLNKAISLSIGVLLCIDTFYARQDSILFYVVVALGVIYFLVRLYGVILLLQNGFKYPYIGVFVYLCTFEIVPVLVIAKLLFVTS